jgi:7-carboxy-7-deazaguanine synthase
VLRVTEIFHSVQGETSTMGLPTTFVRLTGCPLRCQYCDTAYAFSGGTSMAVDAILEQVAKHSARYVTVTGGEPLAQSGCLELLTRLCDSDYRVSLETSGALDISPVDSRVVRVMDLKTPGSGEAHRNLYANVAHLTRSDEVKFVICDRADYEWARMKLDELDLASKVAEVLFSPSYQQLDARMLAEWVLDDGLDVRVQIQLHKLLWGDVPGR